MAIVSCPECGKKLKVADTSVGKKIKCSCGEVFLAQMEPGLTHEKVLARLRVAQRIHRVLARLTLPLLIGDTDAKELPKFDMGRLLALDALDVEATQPVAGWPYQERTRRRDQT